MPKQAFVNIISSAASTEIADDIEDNNYGNFMQLFNLLKQKIAYETNISPTSER